jgi:hypothetical protein
MREGTGAGVYRQSVGRRVSFSLGRYATVFQTEIYAILACVYEIHF